MNKLLKYSLFGVLVLFLILSGCGINDITSNTVKGDLSISNSSSTDINFGKLDVEYEEGKILVGYEDKKK